MKNKKNIVISIILLASIISLSGCFKSTPPTYKVDLEIWGLFDSNDAYGKIITQYRELNPYLGGIKYKKLEVETYKKELIDAMASGQGPDIFLMNSAWLPGFKDKIEPSPEWITNEQEFKNTFPDVVVNDFFVDKKIYATPLSVDSLALYYNKDVLNEAGLTVPPATWEEVMEYIQRIRKIDEFGSITRAGLAMGRAENVYRPADLLSVLMMQKGAEMTNDRGEPKFVEAVMINGQKVRAGEEGLDFYTQFANPANAVAYTWNSRMHNSVDSFYENSAAMMVSYSFHTNIIKSKNAKLNFAVAPLPQFKNGKTANYANYWGYAVAKNKAISGKNGAAPEYDNNLRVHEAWQFLKYLTFNNKGSLKLTNGKAFVQCMADKKSDCFAANSKDFPISLDPAQSYLEKTGRPAARRDIIEKQKSDPFFGPFAYGSLVAKSWRQADPEAVEKILEETIASVNNGNAGVADALSLAQSRIRNLK